MWWDERFANFDGDVTPAAEVEDLSESSLTASVALESTYVRYMVSVYSHVKRVHLCL